MPTKTEYRKYIGSPEWQTRRKKFLEGKYSCTRCRLPRAIVIIAYDQDLHVHHKSYANVGREKDEDLEPLCKRCHEIETFGESQLHKPTRYECIDCGGEAWNPIERLCVVCAMVREWKVIVVAMIAKHGVRAILDRVGEEMEYQGRLLADDKPSC